LLAANGCVQSYWGVGNVLKLTSSNANLQRSKFIEK
jgi:hypothetical protein